MTPGAWPLACLMALGVGVVPGYYLGRADARADLAVAEPVCGTTQRVIRIQLSPALEALVERRRGDRWAIFEARELPRGGPPQKNAHAGQPDPSPVASR